MLAKLEAQKAPISQPVNRRSESSVATVVEQIKAIQTIVTEAMKPSTPLPPPQLEGSSFSRFNI